MSDDHRRLCGRRRWFSFVYVQSEVAALKQAESRQLKAVAALETQLSETRKSCDTVTTTSHRLNTIVSAVHMTLEKYAGLFGGAVDPASMGSSVTVSSGSTSSSHYSMTSSRSSHGACVCREYRDCKYESLHR
jgi:hypothetical protein